VPAGIGLGESRDLFGRVHLAFARVHIVAMQHDHFAEVGIHVRLARLAAILVHDDFATYAVAVVFLQTDVFHVTASVSRCSMQTT
jgi:hypothetical protein